MPAQPRLPPVVARRLLRAAGVPLAGGLEQCRRSGRVEPRVLPRRQAEAGGGYLEYWFPKLGGKVAQPKRSYVQLFKPFGWVIGSGYYR